MRMKMIKTLQWGMISTFALLYTAPLNAQEGLSGLFRHYYGQGGDELVGTLEGHICGEDVRFGWRQNISAYYRSDRDESGLISGSTPGQTLFTTAEINGKAIDMTEFEKQLSEFLQRYKSAHIAGGYVHCGQYYEHDEIWGVTLILDFSKKYISPRDGFTTLDLRFRADQFHEFLGVQ